jgi:hypothetical protein
MEKFEVKLQGKNFFFNQNGEPGRFGFYARRFVRADNPTDAGKMAVILTRQSPVLKEALSDEGPARQVIHLVQVKKANPLTFLFRGKKIDIEFYPEEEG